MRAAAFRSTALPILLIFALAGESACDQEQDTSNQPVGYSEPSSDPQPGILRPVSPEEPEEVAARGQLLYDMERALDMAVARGLAAAGNVRDEIILPVAEIDPGGTSGQVVFFRWRNEDVPDAADLDPTKAERYLLAALMLKPDRVIDLEKLTGYVQPQGKEFYRIAAILAATRKLQSVAPDARFRFHPLIEETTQAQGGGARTKFQTRVYAMGAGEDDPDYEVVVLGPQRNKDAEILTTTEVHGKAQRADTWIRTGQAHVTPLTVARVLAAGVAGESFEVETTTGKVAVSTRTGLPVSGGGS